MGRESERWDLLWDTTLRSTRINAMKAVRSLDSDNQDKDLQEQLGAIGRYVAELERFFLTTTKQVRFWVVLVIAGFRCGERHSTRHFHTPAIRLKLRSLDNLDPRTRSASGTLSLRTSDGQVGYLHGLRLVSTTFLN